MSMTEYERLQGLLYRLREIMPEIGENPVADEMYNLVFEYAENTDEDVAPVVHARWELCYEGYRQQIAGDKCSACGFEHYGYGISHYHYCPNCGAKMDESEDEE